MFMETGSTMGFSTPLFRGCTTVEKAHDKEKRVARVQGFCYNDIYGVYSFR